MPVSLKKIVLLHDLSHDLKIKKKYSEPKIMHFDYELQRTWYVYYSFRNAAGYLQRMDNLYASNTLNKIERLEYLKVIKTNLSDMLKSGYNPLGDDNVGESKDYDIDEAIKFALEIKKQTQSANTYANYKSRIEKFQVWLNKNGFEKRFITAVNKKAVINYLNTILTATSARNRDNTRLDLSGLFQVLEDNEIIPQNIIKKINVVGSTPEKNKPFSSQQEKAVFDYIDKNNLASLDLFIRFVSYTFLRPVEVCRLKIQDINIIDKTIRIKAKTGFQIAILPDILLELLPDISNCEKDSFLFGYTGFGQYWQATETNRRNQFSKWFLVVKNAIKLSDEYNIYSFRHTYAIKLYNNFVLTMSQDDAESKLMSITRHKTKDALRKYLRDINAYRPEDYSKHLK